MYWWCEGSSRGGRHLLIIWIIWLSCTGKEKPFETLIIPASFLFLTITLSSLKIGVVATPINRWEQHHQQDSQEMVHFWDSSGPPHQRVPHLVVLVGKDVILSIYVRVLGKPCNKCNVEPSDASLAFQWGCICFGFATLVNSFIFSNLILLIEWSSVWFNKSLLSKPILFWTLCWAILDPFLLLWPPILCFMFHHSICLWLLVMWPTIDIGQPPCSVEPCFPMLGFRIKRVLTKKFLQNIGWLDVGLSSGDTYVMIVICVGCPLLPGIDIHQHDSGNFFAWLWYAK